jgi:hypothetical protein
MIIAICCKVNSLHCPILSYSAWYYFLKWQKGHFTDYLIDFKQLRATFENIKEINGEISPKGKKYWLHIVQKEERFSYLYDNLNFGVYTRIRAE